VDNKKGENYELIKSHFDEVILASPALAVSEPMLIEVMMDNVAVALQQNNSYKKQDYTENHASINDFLPPRKRRVKVLVFNQ
jgi:hypothetical protein